VCRGGHQGTNNRYQSFNVQRTAAVNPGNRPFYVSSEEQGQSLISQGQGQVCEHAVGGDGLTSAIAGSSLQPLTNSAYVNFWSLFLSKALKSLSTRYITDYHPSPFVSTHRGCGNMLGQIGPFRECYRLLEAGWSGRQACKRTGRFGASHCRRLSHRR